MAVSRKDNHRLNWPAVVKEDHRLNGPAVVLAVITALVSAPFWFVLGWLSRG